jgi:hypothetical protein
MNSQFSIFDFRLKVRRARSAVRARVSVSLLLAAALGAAGLGACLLLTAAGSVAAQEKQALGPGSSGVDPLTEIKVVERVRAATARALEYLRSKQKPDGSWHNNNAVNAVVLLAFMGRGHTPGRGPYRDVLEKGKKLILAKANPATGYLSLGTMYEHGLATLCLAEMYGMDPDPELEAKLRKAVELIEKIQSPNGGWNYSPAPGDGDLSVSVMQIVALRAANNAGIPVGEQVIKKAIKYVQAKAHPSGGYGYAGPGQGPQTSAAGILSLQLLGDYDDPTIPKALDYLQLFKTPEWDPATEKRNGPPPPQPTYFYYFHYYAIQANYQAGGKYWDQWHGPIRELLLKHQGEDGSWDVPPQSAEVNVVKQGVLDPTKVYSTAMACLVLDIYMHFLPAYQR